MSRMNHGPLTKTKGKLGGVVFQQYEGLQVAREYQPVVKNPQSEKQVENRAKFKNASQLTALFKEVLMLRLSKLSIYDRERRGIAVNTFYRVADTPTDTLSEINLDNAVASLNSKAMTEYIAPVVTVSGANYSVTAPDGAVILGVIVGFDSDGYFKTRKVVSATSEGSAVTFPQLTGVTEQRALFVYSIATSEDGRAIFDSLTLGATGLQIEIVRLVSNGDAEVSDIAVSGGE